MKGYKNVGLPKQKAMSFNYGKKRQINQPFFSSGKGKHALVSQTGLLSPDWCKAR